MFCFYLESCICPPCTALSENLSNLDFSKLLKEMLFLYNFQSMMILCWRSNQKKIDKYVITFNNITLVKDNKIFYLHFVCWKNGRQVSNIHPFTLSPFWIKSATAYLYPPLFSLTNPKRLEGDERIKNIRKKKKLCHMHKPPVFFNFVNLEYTLNRITTDFGSQVVADKFKC